VETEAPISRFSSFLRKNCVVVILALLLIPLLHTGSHIYSNSPNPKGSVPYPSNLDSNSEGFVLIILDGVGNDYLLNPEQMPLLNQYRVEKSSTLMVRTGPLTLSATCVSEMMTGVPNSPINGLRNFDLTHPGGDDPWLLASKDSRYNVAMVGSYVMGNIYSGKENITFENTFKGHSDYNEGDSETLDIAIDWLDNSDYNVLAVHFSGPDKVGHAFGLSDVYDKKISKIDKQVAELLDEIPSSWSVIVTADHGMTDFGVHGSAEEETRNVAAIASGPDILVGQEAKANQRDLSAILPPLLGLPFPNQLHGRIPIDILNLSNEDRNIIENWNWEAAYERQTFVNKLNGYENPDLNPNEADWDEITVEGDFSRTSDMLVSILTWSAIAILFMIGCGLNLKNISKYWKMALLFVGIISVFLISHYSLSYSAMIPRAIGGLCAVLVVGYSLQLSQKSSAKQDTTGRTVLKFLVSNYTFWILLTLLLLVTLQSVSRVVVSLLLLYCIVYSINSGFGYDLNKRLSAAGIKTQKPLMVTGNKINSTHAYAASIWGAAILAFTFGSIRLWFTLIPFMFLLSAIILQNRKDGVSALERLPVYSIFTLCVYAVLFIHRRILGENYVLEAVKIGWPENLETFAISALLLCICACVAVSVTYQKFEVKECLKYSLCLNICLLAIYISNSLIDRILLLLILSSYIYAIFCKFKSDNNSAMRFSFLAISMQMVLTWGAWSAFVTVILLSCSDQIWRYLKSDVDSKLSFKNPKLTLSMAVFPWVIWILWWTLLGQVNGVQTCFEGICPHPRELDPGSVLVRGGYVGFRDNPPLLWMVFIISSPIFITSCMLLYKIAGKGVQLKPYLISQLLIILGCISILAFSPKYPRLMFSLTWNVFFATLQVTFIMIVLVFGLLVKSRFLEESIPVSTGDV